MSRSLRFVLVLLLLTVVADAQAQQVDRIEIVEWGIFRSDRVDAVPDPHSPSGVSYLGDLRHQQRTTTVPALAGMMFGVEFTVVGSPPGAKVRLKYVIRFPSQGLTNPTEGKTYFSAEYNSDAVVGGISYDGCILSPDWVIEPGPWTLELWHGGRKLAEKTFMVTRLASSAQ